MPKAENMVYFDMDDPATYGVFETLPRYIQEKVSQAENFLATGLTILERNGNGTAAFSYGEAPPANYPGDAALDDEIEGTASNDQLAS